MDYPHAADCWYLSGPTASGKTGIGVQIARLLDAEIISLDSMAIYRDMDIGTAKPTPDERDGVPHHLIDIVSPCDEFSVAEYVEQAHRTIGEIRARGRVPLFVGGTPLYLKAMLRGLFEGPPADDSLRAELQQIADSEGTHSLHRRLEEVDPASAERLHPNDARRIIRALEVHRLTGRPISEFQKQFDSPATAGPFRVFVLDWPREVLYERINQRVDMMIREGLVDEVRRLLAQWSPLGKTASQAVGYREVIEHFDGRHSLGRAVELIKTHSRQFAKRQGTWFRSLVECRFINMPEFESAESAALHIRNSGIGPDGSL